MINLFIYLRPILKYKSNAFNVTKLKSVSRISTNLYSVMHWNIYYILMCHHKRKSAYYALYLIMALLFNFDTSEFFYIKVNF
jgi:hypothetical protein